MCCRSTLWILVCLWSVVVLARVLVWSRYAVSVRYRSQCPCPRCRVCVRPFHRADVGVTKTFTSNCYSSSPLSPISASLFHSSFHPVAPRSCIQAVLLLLTVHAPTRRHLLHRPRRRHPPGPGQCARRAQPHGPRPWVLREVWPPEPPQPHHPDHPSPPCPGHGRGRLETRAAFSGLSGPAPAAGPARVGVAPGRGSWSGGREEEAGLSGQSSTTNSPAPTPGENVG